MKRKKKIWYHIRILVASRFVYGVGAYYNQNAMLEYRAEKHEKDIKKKLGKILIREPVKIGKKIRAYGNRP